MRPLLLAGRVSGRVLEAHCKDAPHWQKKDPPQIFQVPLASPPPHPLARLTYNLFCLIGPQTEGGCLAGSLTPFTANTAVPLQPGWLQQFGVHCHPTCGLPFGGLECRVLGSPPGSFIPVMSAWAVHPGSSGSARCRGGGGDCQLQLPLPSPPLPSPFLWILD